MTKERKGVAPDVNSGYVASLSRMIACKTVWTHEGTFDEEFQKFYRTLEELFPHLTAKAKRFTIKPKHVNYS